MAEIELRAGDACARISPLGAEALSWRVGAHELLWRPQGEIWERVSPLLFPVVGWCRDARVRVDGASYPMGVHGFAAQRAFEIEDVSPSHAVFVLRDDAFTRAHYPFAFSLRASYSLTPSALRMELRIRNEGAGAMPFACGVHPGFRWPLAGASRSGHRIVFEAEEARDAPVIAPGGLFSPQRRTLVFDGRTLPLEDELFAQEALCFLNARSKTVRYVAGDGATLACRFESFPHLALWSKPGAPFLCVEGWTGHGDPVGFDGDLFVKPSMIALAPQAESIHAASFDFNMAAVERRPRA